MLDGPVPLPVAAWAATVLDEVVVYYSFDGETISGNTISDQSGNGHDATFTNSLGSLTHSSDVPFGVSGGVVSGANTVSTDEDTALEIDLSSYASDVDGDDLILGGDQLDDIESGDGKNFVSSGKADLDGNQQVDQNELDLINSQISDTSKLFDDDEWM